jgi:O-antigen ligase
VEVEQRPHNLLIQILSESGLLGTSMFLLLMFAVFRLAPASWRHRTRTEVDFLSFLFLISCVTLLAQGALENSLFYFQTSCLFWLGVGIWRGRAGENNLNGVHPD